MYSTRMFLTCDLGLDLALHLQRVDEDAAVTDEAGAGYASVWLAESLFIKILPETYRKRERIEEFKVCLQISKQYEHIQQVCNICATQRAR